MQHDPFRSDHDLDLRSNFQNDRSRSTYSSFDASRQDEHDAGKSNVVALLSQKLLPKNICRENGYFYSFCPLEAKPLTWGQIWEHYSERSVKGLSNALFCGAVALLVPELADGSFQTYGNGLNLTFDDLWWPDLWPDLKTRGVYPSFFLMLFRLPLTACRYVAQEPS